MSAKKDTTKSLSLGSRVFVGLFEIAGYHGRIVDHLREAGYPISFIEVTPHRFEYRSEELRSDYKYLSNLRRAVASKNLIRSRIKFRAIGIHLFFWAIRNHDVFVFVTGRSFSRRNLDLYVLRMMRKRIVSFVAHGSEARPAFMDGAHWSNALASADPILEIFSIFKSQKKTLRRIERHSDLVIAHHMTSQLLTKPSVSWMHIGIPSPARTELASDDSSSSRTEIRLVHTASDRRAKGSDRILEIIERIRVDHNNLVYEELTGLTNAEVLIHLAQSDIVIEQMYSDLPLAGLGTEAAALGAAVLVGSHGANELASIFKHGALPPSLLVHPKLFESTLRHLIENTQYRTEVAKQSELFVNDNWNISAVSSRYLSVVKGTFPHNWFFDPTKTSYLHGSGLGEIELIDIWKRGLSRYGDAFFKINHRPDLLKRIKSMINLLDNH